MLDRNIEDVSLKLAKVSYEELNSRQKENFNFQKFAGHLADYGYNCLRLSDDWNGADFIACHIDGSTFVKVQLKGRMTIQKKYIGQGIHIAFYSNGQPYLYPHDALVDYILTSGTMNAASAGWDVGGGRSWNTLPKWAALWLKDYRI